MSNVHALLWTFGSQVRKILWRRKPLLKRVVAYQKKNVLLYNIQDVLKATSMGL